MRKEYSSTKIVFQTICPMLVITKMSDCAQDNYPKCLAVTPAQFARQAVRSIGLIDDTTGCLNHQLQYSFFYKLFPKWFLDLGSRKNCEESRRRALAKLTEVRVGTSGEPLLE
jgi:short-subunit dehydrogenase